MDTFLIIALLVLAAGIGNFLMLKAYKASAAHAAVLSELAAQHGWTFTDVKATRRSQGHYDIVDHTAGWTLSIYGGGDNRVSEWRDPTLALPDDGLALYAPPMPEKTRQMAGRMMEKMGGLGRVMLDTFAKGLGPRAADMRLVEDDSDPATLFATPGAEAAFDGLKNAPELLQLNAFGSNLANSPVLVRGSKGLEMKINRQLRDAGEIEAYLTVALTLRQKLTAP